MTALRLALRSPLGRLRRAAAAGVLIGLLAAPAAPALAQSAADAAARPNAHRSLSERGLTFIERHEGFSAVLYNDSAGNCTIGYGHLLHHGGCTAADHAHYSRGVTRARARTLLRGDVGIAEGAVRGDVRVPLNQHQFDALVSFTFNIGTNAFRGSTLLRVLNQGHYGRVPAQMMRWVLGGLEQRRRDEVRLWSHGQYT